MGRERDEYGIKWEKKDLGYLGGEKGGRRGGEGERERERKEIDSKVTKRREMGKKRNEKESHAIQPRKFDVRRGKRRIPLELEATSLPRDIEIRLK